MRFGDAVARENVVDLADADDVETRGRQRARHGGAGRDERKVVTVCRTREVGVFSGVGPCDDAADAVLAREQFTRDAAAAVEFVKADVRLMRGNLEHAVGGRIDDELSGRNLLAAVV